MLRQLNDRPFDRENFQEWIDMALTSIRGAMEDLEATHSEILSAVRASDLPAGSRLSLRAQAVADTVTALQLMASRLGADVAALGLVAKSPVALEVPFSETPASADAGNHTPHPAPSNGAGANTTAPAPLGV